MSQRVRGLLDRLLARRRADTGDGVPDAELLRRFAHTRDEAAFELLVWRHGPMVLGLCRRAIRDEQLAEDAFQAVFLVLARKAGSVRGNLGGWLFKVARRVAHRANARRPVTAAVPDLAQTALPDPVERDELAALLDDEVARLPERLRRPVVLCYLGGHSTEDAARELGCPRGTVLSRLSAARARLAERLTRRGVTLPATLAVAGGSALTPRVVSATLHGARHFVLGSGPLTTPMILAHGVNHAMTRSTLLTAFGGVLLVAALASGVGLVVAQNGPPVPAADGAERIPAAPPAPPAARATPKEPPAAKPDPNAARREADEKLRSLEKFAAALRDEIELQEKSIEVAGGGAEKHNAALALLRKRLIDAEAALLAVERELAKLEAETKILKKHLEDKDAPAPDAELVSQAIAADPLVVKAVEQLQRVQQFLADEQKRSKPDNPYLKELQEKVSASEKEVAAVKQSVRAKVVAALRAERAAALRKRVEELAVQIEIKKEEREKLLRERDEIKKMIETSAAPVARLDELRKSIEPQRELLAKVQRQILLTRAQRDGVTLPEPAGTDAKLDAILKELVELRKEVRELQQKK